MNRDEMLLVKLAVERQWITREQVEECVRDRDDDGETTLGRQAQRPLGVVMVARKLITDRQLVELMEEVRKKTGGGTPRPTGTKRLGEILVDLGMLKAELLEPALEEQRRMPTPRRRIGEILAEKGHVTRAQVVEALKRQDKTVMACGGCGTRFNVQGYRPWVQYACKRCGGPLEMDLGSLGVSATTSDAPAVRTSPESLPADVAAVAQRASTHFGRFIIINEMLRGDFGPLYRGWETEERRYVGLVFLVPSADGPAVARLFGRVQARLREAGHVVDRALEIGEHAGRRFMVLPL